MKLSRIVFLGLALSSLPVFGLEDIKEVKNWEMRYAANGKIEMAWDENENAMRFSVSYPENSKEGWLYPGIRISDADRNADFLEFEIRMEANPEGRGVKNCLVLFKDQSFKGVGQYYYSLPGKEFKKIKIDLRKKGADMEKTRYIKIGLDFKDAAEGAIWIRNIAFTTEK